MAACVLVVDDDPANRKLASEILTRRGYRVVVARSGREAIELFDRERPACILLDVQMPDLDGPSTCRAIRARPGGFDVSIVFVTAQHDVAAFDRSTAAGGDDFITKPYRGEELVARVETAVELLGRAPLRNELYVAIKRQRDDLQRLQLHKEQLTSFVVHDLKNPVGAIELLAQVVLRDPALGARARDSSRRIVGHARQLARMIATLLDIVKADEGALAPHREPLDAPALLASVVDELRDAADDAGVALAASASAPRIHGDRELVRRVLENLVDNAIRHSPEGSTIDLTATPAVGAVELRVRDRDDGVPAERHDRVFDRFESTGTTRGHSGLGLAFCKIAIEAHGGRIWVEDAAPGAAFCLQLPGPPQSAGQGASRDASVGTDGVPV